MKNKKIYILAIGLAVILTGCSFNLAKKQNVLEIKKEPVVNNIATSSVEVATSTIVIGGGNFILYKDYKNGFQIQYPREWKKYENNLPNQVLHISVISDNAGYQDMDSADVYINAYNESTDNLKNWIKDNVSKIGDFFNDASSDGAINTLERKEITFLDRQCFYREFSSNEGGIYKEYVVNAGKRIYDLTISIRVGKNHPELEKKYNQELKEVFNSIKIFE